MPRSNKKKPPLRPPSKSLPSQSFLQSSDAISYLLEQEKTQMISKAIASGRKHGINMKHGSSNPGTGDCAFESVIQNNNDRSCFRDKFLMPIDYYRKIFVTDMFNRTVDTTWNISSNELWLEGWKQMLIPGAYERGIFGDLMLPGIACGVRKYLLIFNTNSDSPHDPISVIDPSKFNVKPDTEVPIVLAYNLSHYESMHPYNENDIQTTVNLVKEYLEGRYKFGRNDLPFLLALEKEMPLEDHEATDDTAQERPIENQETTLPTKTCKAAEKKGHTNIKKKIEENYKERDKWTKVKKSRSSTTEKKTLSPKDTAADMAHDVKA